MFAITGATGKTGSRIAAALLADNLPVRLITRSPQKVTALRDKGAEVVEAQLTNVESTRRAVDGCNGVYVITPLDWTTSDPIAGETAIGKAVAEALAGTTAHVVYLSVLKARDKTGVPHFDSKGEIEELLDASCANLTVLRPAFFMENFLTQAQSIATARIVSFPLRGDQPVAMVSCADIAEIVKQAFVRGPKAKESYDVIGLRCYTMGECARLIGNAVGRTAIYKPMAQTEYARLLKTTGSSDRAVADLAAMFSYFDSHLFSGDFDNVRKAFKYTSVTFEKFAQEVARIVRPRALVR